MRMSKRCMVSILALSLVAACDDTGLTEVFDGGRADSPKVILDGAAVSGDTGMINPDMAASAPDVGAADTGIVPRDVGGADTPILPRDTGASDTLVIARDTGTADVGVDARDTGAVDVGGDTRDSGPTDGPGCFMGGRSYAIGESFPTTDGCNTCTCLAAGLACTARACVADAADSRCPLTTSLTLWYDGGMRVYTEQAVVKETMTFTRTYAAVVDGGAPRTCTAPLPACGSPTQIDLVDIAADLAAPEVVAAFALPDPTVYGVDPRGYDGTLFAIRNSAGKTLYVGADCPSPAMSSCRPVPAGVKTLATDLKSLFETARAATACAGL